jgi:hypothetical protein
MQDAMSSWNTTLSQQATLTGKAQTHIFFLHISSVNFWYLGFVLKYKIKNKKTKKKRGRGGEQA